VQPSEESTAKQKVPDVDVCLSSVRRGKDENRSRPRFKSKPPRSMYLSRSDLASAVRAPSGIVDGETLVKMTESQLLALKRQASYCQSCANYKCLENHTFTQLCLVWLYAHFRELYELADAREIPA